MQLAARPGLSYVALWDRVPFSAELVSGTTRADGPLGRGRPLRLAYRVRCPHVGRLRFEGVKLRLADLQGFFHHVAFVRQVVFYRVLPRLVESGGRPATKKRHNLLPPPGIHRLRRPGSGSELLDLRDYLPGDPPKTIAWKVSARRDRLITKEFESEVPVRCTLFVDTSSSVRVGPVGRNALGRLVEVAAAVAQANTAERDLTGLVLFDEARAAPVRPARGARHLVTLLNLLADAAALGPSAGDAPVQPLLGLGHALAEEVYPDLLRDEVNHVPWWMPWLVPVPWYGGGRRFPFRGVLGQLFLALAFLPLVALALCVRWLLPVWPAYLAVALLGWFWYRQTERIYRLLPQWLSPRRRAQLRMRKRMASLLALRHGLGPGGPAALLEDDAELSSHLQQFLADHQVPYQIPLYDGQGRYRFVAPEKVEILAGALLRAVGKGHDNELFVVLADLLELGDRAEPVVRAIKVALARHHQVVVVCPWPPGVPPNEIGGPSAAGGVRLLLERAEAARFHQAHRDMRQRLAKMSVPLVSARGDEPVRLVLERMDRLRLAGRRR